MAKDANGVEIVEVVAPTPQEAVETKPPVAAPDDPVAKILALEVELKKTASDRDNYRTAVLAGKGKIPTEELDLNDPVQLAAFIQKTVKDAQQETKSEAALQALLAEAKASATRESELRRALASKTASTAMAGGSGSGSGQGSGSAVNKQYFSDEQLAELKKRGLNDAQIKQIEALDRSGAPGAAKTR